MTVPSQFAWRSQKAVGIFSGAPNYVSLTGSIDESVLQSAARTFQYSQNGSLVAFAFDNHCLVLSTNGSSSSSSKDEQCKPLHTFEVDKVVDLQFSPKGRFLSTWKRPFKDAEDKNAKNLQVWDCESGECVGSFERKNQQGCHFQFTENEDACLRMVTNELHVFDPKEIEGNMIGRLKLEGLTSYEVGPGEKPTVAVFCGERKGAPASVRIYSLASLLSGLKETPNPTSQKTFFKADKIQIKWNTQGTALLFATSTDHDKTGKSYYGETNLYMMSTRGDFDCRIALDKEGPVHDFEWNPNGREFIAVYGYMPAKSTLFSYRVNVIAELGTSSRNFVAFNPQGRLFCLAGFGNLSGTVDVWDREKLGRNGIAYENNSAAKLFSFDASNSSTFQWSPDGQFILTATLSPRLRVDNGVRIWHCTGQLVHVDMINELYQASWRPTVPSFALQNHPFPASLPPTPSPSPAAQAAIEAKQSRSIARTGTSGGVYRPPGARHLPPSELRKIEEAANLPYNSNSNSNSPSASGASTPSGAYVPPNKARAGGARRTVPGAAPVSSTKANQQQNGTGNKRNATSGKSNGNVNSISSKSATVSMAADIGGFASVDVQNGTSDPSSINGSAKNGQGADVALPGALDKKLRNLNKKLKAIQELKERRDKGEKLEQTQLQKIASEQALRKELSELE
ncbi:hypothetical protein L7F22_053871 [Adiantum nelumboides]|nr:hypothetical protein [Adiantum nelumboides]